MSITDKDKMSLFDEFMEDQDFARMERQEDFILTLTETIVSEMERRGITRAELADRLGKTRSCISQYLNGSRNLTCRTLADIAYAINCKPHLVLWRAVETLEEDTSPKAVVVDFPYTVYQVERPGAFGSHLPGDDAEVTVNLPSPYFANFQNAKRNRQSREGTV